MNFIKIFGLILLIAGLAIIFWSLYSSYNIFTSKTASPEIFATPKEGAKPPTGKVGQNIQEQAQQMLGEQLKGLFPAPSIKQLLNLIAWSIFAGILIVGGSQISNIGIRLLKKD